MGHGAGSDWERSKLVVESEANLCYCVTQSVATRIGLAEDDGRRLGTP